MCRWSCDWVAKTRRRLQYNRQIDTCLKTVSMPSKIKGLKQRDSKVGVRQIKKTRSETESETDSESSGKQAANKLWEDGAARERARHARRVGACSCF